MSSEANVQTVKDIYAAFTRGDRDTMLATLAENIRFESESAAGEIPWAGVHVGHAEFLTILDQLAEHVQFDVFEQSDFLASESQVATVSHMEWTLKKNGGKGSYPEFVQLWTFNEAGKVARVVDIYDPTPLLTAWRG